MKTPYIMMAGISNVGLEPQMLLTMTRMRARMPTTRVTARKHDYIDDFISIPLPRANPVRLCESRGLQVYRFRTTASVKLFHRLPG